MNNTTASNPNNTFRDKTEKNVSHIQQKYVQYFLTTKYIINVS